MWHVHAGLSLSFRPTLPLNPTVIIFFPFLSFSFICFFVLVYFSSVFGGFVHLRFLILTYPSSSLTPPRIVAHAPPSRPAALQSIHNHTRHARAHPPLNRMMRVPCRKPCERACAKAPYKTRGPIPSPDRLFRRARGAAVQAQERGQEEGVLAGTGCGVVEG